MAASTSRVVPDSFRKRSNAGGSDSDVPLAKSSKTSITYYYVLEPESQPPSEEDAESIHSVQDKPTDSAKDTSDLSYSDEDSDIVYTMGEDGVFRRSTASPVEEYEPASLSEKESLLPDILTSASDSDSTKIIETIGLELLVSLADQDEDTWADTSSISSDESSKIDPELSLRDYWSCVQCKATNNNPLFRYCEKCYKVRKNFFPPRPKGKNKKKKKRKNRKRSRKCVTQHTSDEAHNNQVKLKVSGQTLASGCIEEQSKISLSPNHSTAGSSIENNSGDCADNNTNSYLNLSQRSTVLLDNNSDRSDYASFNSHDVETDSFDPVISQEKISAKDDSSLSNLENRICVNSTVESYESVNSRGLLVCNSGSLNKNISLDSGVSNKSLDCEENKSLDSGGNKSLDSGGNNKSLDSGGNNKSLDSGGNNKSLDSGGNNKSIDSSLLTGFNNNKEDKHGSSTALCETCMTRPRNAVFVHSTKLGHMYCCYQCSKKIWHDTGRCPLCNCKVMHILRIISP